MICKNLFQLIVKIWNMFKAVRIYVFGKKTSATNLGISGVDRAVVGFFD